jgi:hypothetical protein
MLYFWLCTNRSAGNTLAYRRCTGKVFSYVCEDVQFTKESAEELLRLNATTSFGSFGLTFDGDVIYSYSLAGANMDFNEFAAAIQTVATIADSYDEKIKNSEVINLPENGLYISAYIS